MMPLIESVVRSGHPWPTFLDAPPGLRMEEHHDRDQAG
jgi:hypothetical protein